MILRLQYLILSQYVNICISFLSIIYHLSFIILLSTFAKDYEATQHVHPENKRTSENSGFVQLRDDNFTLLAYFRVDRPEKALAKCGLGEQEAKVIGIINEIPFGKVMKLEI